MTYEENFYLPPGHPGAKVQRESHEKIIKAVTQQLKLDHPPPYTFLGANPSEYVEELEKSKEGKSPKEIKEIGKQIQQLQSVATNHDKLIFDFNDIITRLVVTSSSVPTTGGNAFYTRWTALLNFTVSDQFIFGRSCKKPRHGSGTYCFAPINFPVAELEKIINERTQEAGSEETLLKLVQVDSLIKLLDGLRYAPESLDHLRTMRQLVEEKQLSGIKLIDSLNQNKNLMKKMQSVGHFGAVQQGLSLLRSDTDVSTICLPVKTPQKEVTFIILVSFEIYGHKKSLEGLYALVDALKAV